MVQPRRWTPASFSRPRFENQQAVIETSTAAKQRSASGEGCQGTTRHQGGTGVSPKKRARRITKGIAMLARRGPFRGGMSNAGASEGLPKMGDRSACGNDGGEGTRDRALLLLPRVARWALLPSLALAGFAPAAAAAAAAAAGVGTTGAATALSTLLTNRWYVWAVLIASSSAGLWSERTRWGAAVSSPLVTMLLTITLCNVGVIPAASPAYDTVNQVFVPLAVPLLLFDADLQKVLRFAGTLLACFVIGAAGTVIGTAAAAAVVPLGLGGDGWKIASALAARHIGGAVNYVAVCETLGVSADAIVAGLAADNMVVSLYFIFLFWITKPDRQEEPTPATTTRQGSTKAIGSAQEEEAPAATPQQVSAATAGAAASPPPLAVTKETISYALTAACALCLCGELLSKVAFGGRVSAIPLVTLVTVAGATAAPSWVGRLGSVGAQLGILLMQLFFAVTGAQGSLAVVMGTAPSLLVFSLVQIAVHFGVLVGVGRLFRLPFRELALASNANVGGPTTAAAMAAAKGWKNLVLPALLTGVLGYATATFIGVGIGHAFLKALVAGAGV
ncbi:conserved unknown protein [Ectocarpus siliculosus]|uniref:DUF819 domain-containing protein n=1 Tax=Ectocarpus siliculosus TaxID=2880 RepID=D8LIU9_ECTSI|nr:conserved unknown protein [Ectocarpus siliculosus]|eukprot:CBN76833.1 conserved unknown protein [Ectocarpus siliculosus]